MKPVSWLFVLATGRFHGCCPGANGSAQQEEASNASPLSVTPRRVGLHGGAEIRISGNGLVPGATVEVDGVPCPVVHARSDPQGTFKTCVAPARKHPGPVGLKIGGVGCKDCEIEYVAELVPVAWVTTSMHVSSEHIPAKDLVLAAGDHLPIVLDVSKLVLLKNSEQIRVTVGNRIVKLR